MGIREGMSLEVSHLSWTKMAKYPINRNDPFPISTAQQKEASWRLTIFMTSVGREANVRKWLVFALL